MPETPEKKLWRFEKFHFFRKIEKKTFLDKFEEFLDSEIIFLGKPNQRKRLVLSILSHHEAMT